MVRNILRFTAGAIAIDALPEVSGSANLKSKHAEGIGEISKTYPTRGKIKGASLTLKGVASLKGSSKKLFRGKSL